VDNARIADKAWADDDNQKTNKIRNLTKIFEPLLDALAKTKVSLLLILEVPRWKADNRRYHEYFLKMKRKDNQKKADEHFDLFSISV